MFKRIFDIIISVLCSVFFSPIALIIIVLIKYDSKGPFLFSTKRVGKNKKLFRIYKFRSMKIQSQSHNLGVTSLRDSRVTKIGKILRKYRLDEIPQLFNVIKGDMSIVGPRPEDPKYVTFFEDKYDKLLSVRPGCVSPGWINFRDEKVFKKQNSKNSNLVEEDYIKNILPKKIDKDLKYIDEMSFSGDIVIIFQSIVSLFFK